MEGLKMVFNKNLAKHVSAGIQRRIDRRIHAPAVPPRNRIPFMTKIVYAVLLSVIPWIYPAWIVVHIPEYQSEKK